MAITKKQVEDKHEVVGDFKIIQVRTATIIEEDGVELSRSFSRSTYSPTDDTSSASEDVKALAKQFHTEEIKKAYKSHVENAKGF